MLIAPHITHTPANTYIHTAVRALTCIRMQKYTHAQTLKHALAQAHVDTHVDTHTDTYKHARAQTYTQIDTHINTDTHK